MRRLCLLLALVLLLAPLVRADVIALPEDSFFWSHRGECATERRYYTANGPENVLVIYRSPESSGVVERIPNGDEIRIDFIYQDENDLSWGYTETGGNLGWVPMSYLLLQYDNRSFTEEFGDRIRSLEDGKEIEAEGTIRLWRYPGSTDCVEVEVDPEQLPDYDTVFVDDGGRTWGFVVYARGYRENWVCLDAPGAPYYELYAEIPPQTVTLPEPPAQPNVVIKPAGPSMGGIAVAAGVLAALSGGFLLLTRKRKT